MFSLTSVSLSACDEYQSIKTLRALGRDSNAIKIEANTTEGTLLGLAPELLRLVIDELSPFAFESAAMTSKQMYEHCRYRIPSHNAYRAVFRHIQFDGESEVSNNDHRNDTWEYERAAAGCDVGGTGTPEFWQDIAANPNFRFSSSTHLLGHMVDTDERIAQWVRTVDFSNDFGTTLITFSSWKAPSRVNFPNQLTFDIDLHDWANSGEFTIWCQGKRYNMFDFFANFFDDGLMRDDFNSDLLDELILVIISNTKLFKNGYLISTLPILLSVIRNVKCVRIPEISPRLHRDCELAFLNNISKQASRYYGGIPVTGPLANDSAASTCFSNVKRIECGGSLQNMDDSLPLQCLLTIPSVTSIPRVDKILRKAKRSYDCVLLPKLRSTSFSLECNSPRDIAAALVQIRCLNRVSCQGSGSSLWAIVKVVGWLSRTHQQNLTALELLNLDIQRSAMDLSLRELQLNTFSNLRRLLITDELVLHTLGEQHCALGLQATDSPTSTVDERYRGRVLDQYLPHRLQTFCLLGDGHWVQAVAMDAIFFNFGANRDKVPALEQIIAVSPAIGRSHRFTSTCASLEYDLKEFRVGFGLWSNDEVSEQTHLASQATDESS